MSLTDLELRILQSKYKEMFLWNDLGLFSVGKGTATSTERWYCYTPHSQIYADSLEELITLVKDQGYHMDEWVSDFREA